MSGSTPGLAVSASRAERLVDRLPSEVSRAAVAAAKRADVLVIDRRTAGTRTERTGEADIAGRTVLVVPKRPGARPKVDCFSREPPETDPAVELLRRTVELDATAEAHYGVASAVAVASGDEAPAPAGGAAEWVAVDEADGGNAPARTGHESLSPSAAEIAARRDSVDTAAARVLEGDDGGAAPLAFCGLSGVIEPLEDA
ncbi:hypothetical protein [Haloglomus litoreum]|uniref:hypothetical protein n=1 Tax=Haloglomus litoreum TaxID=3034026 RepID=UPI0023E8D0DB|nr:hypothetical protein [Haloglomus sp. DT116]